MAKNKIPTAENTVKPRRTLGRARTTDARETSDITMTYQVLDVSACTIESKKIPKAKLKSTGTKAGIKATANTAAFTFVIFVKKPRRKAGPKPCFATPS